MPMPVPAFDAAALTPTSQSAGAPDFTAGTALMPFADLPESVQAEYERIGRERELANRHGERGRRWDLLRVCGEMVVWTALGLVVAGFAFRVTDVQLGMIFLYGGMVINVSGVAFAIASAYRRGEHRGDW